jgi:hypothetical protein
MKNKFVVILATILLLIAAKDSIAGMSEAELQDPASYMAKFDGQHSKEQFQSLLNIMHNYYPERSIKDIGMRTTGMWIKRKDDLPDLSLYDFTLGLKNFIRDSDIGDFAGSLALYTTTKQLGY